jgi:hypothetical protein
MVEPRAWDAVVAGSSPATLTIFESRKVRPQGLWEDGVRIPMTIRKGGFWCNGSTPGRITEKNEASLHAYSISSSAQVSGWAL